MKYRRKADKMTILTSSLISAQFLLEEQPRSTMSPRLADLAQVDRKGHILRREDGVWCHPVALCDDNDDDDAMVGITLLHYALYKIARF